MKSIDVIELNKYPQHILGIDGQILQLVYMPVYMPVDAQQDSMSIAGLMQAIQSQDQRLTPVQGAHFPPQISLQTNNFFSSGPAMTRL